jgi:predicted DNA-binding transcriptional regulator YafY
LRRRCAVNPVETVSRPILSEEWATYEVEFESRGQAQFVVLGLGDKVEVLAPGWLRETVAAQIAELSRMYGVAE